MSYERVKARAIEKLLYIDSADELTIKSTTGSGDAVLQTAPQLLGAVTLGSGATLLLDSDPSNALHAATKQYVDAVANGLDVKASVRVATTANITLSGTQTIDGVSVIVGDRVLVKDQSTGSQNGIYVVASGSWTRSPDADNSPIGEVTSGMFTFVTEGTVNGNYGFSLVTDDPITLGSTSLSFTQFSGAGAFIAGAGLLQSGNQIDIVGTSNRITVNADSIDIAATYVGQTSITTLGTISTGTWSASTISVDKGGTGLTSYTVGDLLYASGTTTVSKLAIGTSNQVLTSTGTAPQWVSGLSITTLAASGAVTFTLGTPSTSTTTGTLIITGGMGVSGSIWAGTVRSSGSLRVNDSTGATTYFGVNGGDGRTAWLTNVDSSTGLYVSPGNFGTTGTTQQGLLLDFQAQSGATTAAIAGKFRINLTSASFTATSIMGIQILDAILGASSAATTQYGLKIENQTKGSTNYALYTGTGLVQFGDTVTLTTNPIFSFLSGTKIPFSHVDNSGTITSSTLLTYNQTTQTFATQNANFSGVLTLSNNYVQTTGSASFDLTDNQAIAFEVKQGSNSYFKVVTTNSSENVTIGNNTTNPSYIFSGTGAVTISGTLNTTGATTFSGGILFSGNAASTQGQIAKATVEGLSIRGIAGSTNDFTIYSADAGQIFSNPTTTRNILLGHSSGTVSFGSSSVSAQIDNAIGNMCLGSSSSTGNGLLISSSMTGLLGSQQAGVFSTPTFSSAAVTNGWAMRALLRTAATSFTMATGVGLRIENATKGAGSTITTLIGLDVADQTQGGTNIAIRTGLGDITLGGTSVSLSNTSAKMAMGTTPDAGVAMYISSSLTGLTGGQQAGIYSQPTFSSTAVTNGWSFRSQLRTAASAFTMTTGVGVRIEDASKGAGSTITTQIGLDVADQTQGGTNIAIRTGLGNVNFGGTLVSLTNTSVSMALGAPAASDVAIYVSELLTGLTSTTPRGLLVRPTFGSNATVSGTAAQFTLITAATSFTMTTGYGARITDATKGAGSTITTQYGLKIEDQTQGGTNYAIMTGLGAVVFGATPTFTSKKVTSIGSGFDTCSFVMENTSVDTTAHGRVFNFGITTVSGTLGRLDLTQPGVQTDMSWHATGGVSIGSTTDNGFKFEVTGTTKITSLLTLGAATTSVASVNIPTGTAPTSPVSGDIWHDSTQKTLVAFVNGGIKSNISTTLWTKTANSTIANTVTETTMLDTGVGTKTLPANFFVPGKTLKFKIYGLGSTTGTPSSRVRVKLGSTVIIDTTSNTWFTSVGGTSQVFEGEITCRTTGGSGTVIGSLKYQFNTTFGSIVNSSTTTIDTTASQVFDIMWTWDTANASNTASFYVAVLEVVN